MTQSGELQKAYNDLIRAIGICIVPEADRISIEKGDQKKGLDDADTADLLLAMTINDKCGDASNVNKTTPITISEAKERSRIALEGTQMIKIASYATSLLPGLGTINVDRGIVRDALLTLLSNAHYVKTRVSTIEERMCKLWGIHK